MENILLIAYDLNPELGSECGIAHTYLRIYSKYFNTVVITFDIHKPYIDNFDYGENVKFQYIKFSFLDKILWKLKLDVISNWLFCNRTRKKIAANNPGQYRFLHIVTPEGYFAFNNIYKLGIKYIIGPINGGLKTPGNFGPIFCKDFLYDFFRNLVYKIISLIPGWRKYYLKAERIIIADERLLNVLPVESHKNTYQIFDVFVDPEEFKPIVNKKLKHDDVTLLYCGRLVPKKGIQLLLDAYKDCMIHLKTTNLNLNIVGRGPLLESVLNFIEKNHFKQNIKVFSNLPKAELVGKYQTADIYCLPTLREPGGLAILEAMSCSLPVITSDYGGPAFSVTPDCGIKIQVNNYHQYVSDLAKAITKLYQNPGIRQAMGVNARERIIKEFSVETVEMKMITLWGILLGNQY